MSIFHKIWGRGACLYGVGIGGVRQGVNEFLQVVYAKPADICYDFAAVLNLFFDYPFWGMGAPRYRR